LCKEEAKREKGSGVDPHRCLLHPSRNECHPAGQQALTLDGVNYSLAFKIVKLGDLKMLWLEEQAKRWLISRGYWVLSPSIPCLVVSYGVGTYTTDGAGTTYHIHMTKGHKLWALNQTILKSTLT
jgi:hypothetical protein